MDGIEWSRVRLDGESAGGGVGKDGGDDGGDHKKS